MRIKIALHNSAEEIDSAVIENPEATEADDMSDQISDMISKWTLSVGNTITICECE